MKGAAMWLMLVLVVACVAVSGAGTNVLVQDAGSSVVNGMYAESGAVAAYSPAYVKGNIVLGYMSFGGKSLWTIASLVSLSGGYQGFYYYNHASSDRVPYDGWEVCSDAMLGLRLGDGSMYWGVGPAPTVSTLEVHPGDVPAIDELDSDLQEPSTLSPSSDFGDASTQSESATTLPSCPEGSPKAQEPDASLATANPMGAVPGTLCIEGRIAGNVDHFTFLVDTACAVSVTVLTPNGEKTDVELMDTAGRPLGFLAGHLPSGRYFVSLRAADRSQDFNYVIQVEGVAWPGTCLQSAEPDSTLDTANPMGALPGSLCMEGRIAGNVDHFSFRVVSACDVTITASAPGGQTAALELMDSAGDAVGLLAGHLSPGTYYVALRSSVKSEEFNYTLHVEGVQPSGACRQSTEPDSSLDTANPMGTIPGSLCMEGRIAGNVDHFTFTVMSECAVTVTASAVNGESIDLELMDETGAGLGVTEDDLQPGRYYVALRATDRSEEFNYAIRVTGEETLVPITPSPLAGPEERLVYRGESWDPTAEELAWATQHGLAYTDVPKPDGATDNAVEWIRRIWFSVDQLWVQTIVVLEPPLDCPGERATFCNESVDPTPEELEWASQHGLIYWDDGPKPLPEGTCGIEWIERHWGTSVEDENACTQAIDILSVLPSLTVPADVEVAGCVSVSSIDPSQTGTPSVDDPCGMMVSLDYQDDTYHGLNPDLGTFHRVWRVSDECGDSHVAIQTITINPAYPYLTGTWPGSLAEGDIVVDNIYIRPQPPIFGNDQAHTLLIVAFAANTAEPPEEEDPVAQTVTLTASVDGSPTGSAVINALPGASGVRYEIRVGIPQVAGCHEVSLTMGETTIYGCVFVHPVGADPDF